MRRIRYQAAGDGATDEWTRWFGPSLLVAALLIGVVAIPRAGATGSDRAADPPPETPKPVDGSLGETVVSFAPEGGAIETGHIGEGSVAIGSAAWHVAGFTGAGQRIAIIDSGFGEWDAAVAAAELPAVPADRRFDHCDRGEAKEAS